MSVKFKRARGTHKRFTIHIGGQPTQWDFRRVSALEDAQITCDLQPLNGAINTAQRAVLANYTTIQRAEDVFKRVADEDELSPSDQAAMSALAALDIPQTAITAEMLAPVYSWLCELLTDVTGFEEDAPEGERGAPVRWADLGEEDRAGLVEMLSSDHAMSLLDKVRDASHLSGEALGK